MRVRTDLKLNQLFKSTVLSAWLIVMVPSTSVAEGVAEIHPFSGDLTPLGAEQTPEDIGHLAVFYASDEARMITGQVVAVDGGITLQRA